MKADPIPMDDLEEAAQGRTHFHAPGVEASREEAGERLSGEPTTDDATLSHRIASRRGDLYEAMERLEASAARPSALPDWVHQVGDALNELEDALEQHVTETEGPNGFLEEIIDGSPHLAPAIDDLRKEHTRLLGVCRNARQKVTVEPVDPAVVRRQVTAILGRLVFHRHKGAELVYDAFNIDVSVGN